MNYQPPPDKQAYFEQVWVKVCDVPKGNVATYGQLAKLIPKPDGVSEEVFALSASRWVGLAMAACPNHVPWHRVVNSQGKISHPDAGKQRSLLLEEGVLFAKDKIDLREFEWRVEGQEQAPQQGRLF